MGSTTSLTFSTGQPTVLELSGKRNLAAKEAPDGSVRTRYDLSLDLKDDNKKLLVTQVSVIVEGIVEKSDEIAFTIKSSMECHFTFPEAQSEMEFEDLGKVRLFCEPLFHRATMLAQDMAWKMGYTAVRLPIMFPKRSSIECIFVSDGDNKPADVPRSAAKKRTRRSSKTEAA